MTDRPRVSVVGGSRLDEDQRPTIEDLGAMLADLDAVLVCGGLGGTMAAVARGYAAAGGPLAVGILPGTDPDAANPAIDLAIPTGLGHGRNMVVALAGDAVVACPGGFGTLTEVGHAKIAGRPLVALDAWGMLPDVETVDSVDAVREVLERRLG